MTCKFCGQETQTAVCSYCGYDNTYGDAFEDLSDNASSRWQNSNGPYAYETEKKHKKKAQKEEEADAAFQTADTDSSAPSVQKNYFNFLIFIGLFLFVHPTLAFLYFIITKILLKPKN